MGSRLVLKVETWEPAVGMRPTDPNPVPKCGQPLRDRFPKSSRGENLPHPTPVMVKRVGFNPKSKVYAAALVVFKPSMSIRARAAHKSMSWEGNTKSNSEGCRPPSYGFCILIFTELDIRIISIINPRQDLGSPSLKAVTAHKNSEKNQDGKGFF